VLLFSRAAWDAPVAGRDAFLHRTLRRHAELLLERLSGADDDVVERVRGELLRAARCRCRSPPPFRVETLFPHKPGLDEGTAAVMCYTSGTTGRSKGVL
jgi:hypothetical protein